MSPSLPKDIIKLLAEYLQNCGDGCITYGRKSDNLFTMKISAKKMAAIDVEIFLERNGHLDLREELERKEVPDIFAIYTKCGGRLEVYEYEDDGILYFLYSTECGKFLVNIEMPRDSFVSGILRSSEGIHLTNMRPLRDSVSKNLRPLRDSDVLLLSILPQGGDYAEDVSNDIYKDLMYSGKFKLSLRPLVSNDYTIAVEVDLNDIMLNIKMPPVIESRGVSFRPSSEYIDLIEYISRIGYGG